MARKLKQYKFPEPRRVVPAGKPWDEWFDGGIWRLTAGRDYTGNPKNFKSTARTALTKRTEPGMHRVLRINVEADGDIVLQAEPPTNRSPGDTTAGNGAGTGRSTRSR